MWVLESFGGVVVAGPFKSEAEMAKKLGLSQQYVNRQIRNCNFRFRLDGRDVLARREKEFVGGWKKSFRQRRACHEARSSPKKPLKKFSAKTVLGLSKRRTEK